MDVLDLHDINPDDDPHCNWCQNAVSNPVADEGMWFCNEICADQYFTEYGRDE